MSKAGASDPVTQDEAAILFAPLQGASVLVALSGGADSVCLLWLLQRWNGTSDLSCATVDHGLRVDSADDAARAGRFARELGVPHAILPWHGVKPQTGIEAKARAARYERLERRASETGATILATGHTLDDQAETVLMRLAAGSGLQGLCGMRSLSRRPGSPNLMHARPLLGLPKSRLLATLKSEGIDWSEDPMNRDRAFARVRVRQAADVLAREGLTPERLGTLAKRMARAEDALEHATADAWAALVTGSDSRLVIGVAALALPEEILLRLLRRAIAEGQSPGALRFERLETLCTALLGAGRTSRPLARTLGGKRVALDGQGIVITTAASRRMD